MHGIAKMWLHQPDMDGRRGIDRVRNSAYVRVTFSQEKKMSSAGALRNESGLDFTDISSEEWREYEFPSGRKVRISNPLQLHVSENGHRVLDAEGTSHYIPVGWIHLSWRAREGAAHFVR